MEARFESKVLRPWVTTVRNLLVNSPTYFSSPSFELRLSVEHPVTLYKTKSWSAAG